MKKATGYLTVGVLFGFLFWNIWQNRGEVSKITWNIKSFDSLFLILSLSLVYLSNIFSWHLTTRALGVRVSFKDNFRVWMFSNLSRLLPGGIWQYPSRVYLLSGQGITKKIGVTAVILESALNLGVGAGVVFLSLAFWKLPGGFEQFRVLLLFFLVFAFLAMFLMNAKFTAIVVNGIKKITKKEGKILTEIKLPARWIVPLLLSFFFKFVFIGTALFFLIRLSVPFDISLLPIVIGAFALSWLLGYVVVFAPGGLGITEVSLASLLVSYMPFSGAAVIVVVFRILLLAAEAVFLGISLKISLFFQYPKKSGR